MATATDEVIGIGKSIIPKIKPLGLAGINLFAWLIIVIIIIGALSVLIVWLILRRRYNKKIILYENNGGQFVPVLYDRGMEVRLSTAGDTITYLRKSKKYIPNPQIQTGIKTYYFFKRSDDEWINFGLSDLNYESKKAGARFLDKEMRYARTAIQRGLKDRYDQPTLWQKYGTFIVTFTFIALIGVFTWLLWDKWIDLANTTANAIQSASVVLDRTDQVLSSMNNICTGGTGLVKQ